MRRLEQIGTPEKFTVSPPLASVEFVTQANSYPHSVRADVETEVGYFDYVAASNSTLNRHPAGSDTGDLMIREGGLDPEASC